MRVQLSQQRKSAGGANSGANSGAVELHVPFERKVAELELAMQALVGEQVEVLYQARRRPLD